jgi:hypothetical protein
MQKKVRRGTGPSVVRGPCAQAHLDLKLCKSLSSKSSDLPTEK